MKTVSRNLLETILRLSISCSHDETRLNLNGVHVFKRDGSTILEAVDSYKLVRETLINDASDLSDETDLILCRKDIKKIKKFLSTYKGRAVFECDLSEASLVINVGTSDLISIWRINREFPRVDSVLPVKIDNAVNAVSIAINPEYLLDLFNSLKTNNRTQHITITFDASNPMGSMLVEIEGNADQVAVLMPCRSSKVASNSEKFQAKNSSDKKAV